MKIKSPQTHRTHRQTHRTHRQTHCSSRLYRRNHGFGLIEILVVVAIILIVAAFYIPKLMGGKDPLTGKKTPRRLSKKHSKSRR